MKIYVWLLIFVIGGASTLMSFQSQITLQPLSNEGFKGKTSSLVLIEIKINAPFMKSHQKGERGKNECLAQEGWPFRSLSSLNMFFSCTWLSVWGEKHWESAKINVG